MKLRTIGLVPVFIMFISISFADYPIGFLSGTDILDVPGKENVKSLEINLFGSPSGDLIGLITFERGPGESFGITQISVLDKIISFDEQDIFWTGYKHGTGRLKYYEVMNNYARVLMNSLDESVWVKIGKVGVNLNVTPTTFIEDISGNETWTLYGYGSYYLRKGPSIEYEKIIKLDENKHVIRKWTGKLSGSWAEVLVYETNEPMHGCYSDDELKAASTGQEFIGWIKVVDDNGQPKDIGYYTSC